MAVEKKNAQQIAFIEWALFFVSITVVAILGGLWSEHIRIALESPVANDRTGVLTIVVLISVAVIFFVFLNVLLTAGVTKEHLTACQIWYTINIIFIVCYTLIWILEFASGLILAMSAGVLLPVIIVIFVKGGLLWYRICAVDIIMNFTKELRSSNNGGHIYRTQDTIGGHIYCIQDDINGNGQPPTYSVAIGMTEKV